MENILRYISGQSFLIEPSWGFQKLNEILMYQDMDIDTTSAFKEMKEASQSMSFFTNGKYAGSDINNINAGSIAHLKMNGVMTVHDGWCHQGMNSLVEQMYRLYDNKAIKGIVLQTDSGGGHSTAGDVLYSGIADKNKPVFIHGIQAASAAIKGTLKADGIYGMSNSSTFGSIGSMLVLPKWYIEEAAESEVELYSEKSPKKNHAWREIKKGNYEAVIEELTVNDEIFMNMVRENRNLKGSEKYQTETLDGRTYPAIEAKRRGIIDGVATLNDLLKKVDRHAKNYYS